MMSLNLSSKGMSAPTFALTQCLKAGFIEMKLYTSVILQSMFLLLVLNLYMDNGSFSKQTQSKYISTIVYKDNSSIQLLLAMERSLISFLL